MGMSEKQEIFSLIGGRVLFNRGIYNPTSDAVWLAAWAGAVRGTVLDVGIGTGGVSLCLATHSSDISKITGLDISQSMLDACAKNAELNSQTIELINSDIFSWRTNRVFDVVVSNPPYFRGTPAIHNAHHNVDLRDWTRACLRRVRPRGHFYTIVDAYMATYVVSVVADVCGDIQIFPLFGAKNTAERVLIAARLGVHGGSIIHRGCAMNNDVILRDGLTIVDALSKLGMQ